MPGDEGTGTTHRAGGEPGACGWDEGPGVTCRVLLGSGRISGLMGVHREVWGGGAKGYF